MRITSFKPKETPPHKSSETTKGIKPFKMLFILLVIPELTLEMVSIGL